MGLFGMFSKAARLKRLVQNTENLHERFAAELAQCPGSNWEFHVVTDRRGKVLKSGWKYEAPPDRFERDGLRNLRSYVNRLVDSKNWYSTVCIDSSDGARGLMLQKITGVVSINFVINRSIEPGRDAHVRAFFKAMGIEPSEDFCAHGEIQLLEFPVTGDADRLTDILVRAATELYSISDEEPIDLKFEEQDERDLYKGEITLHTLYPTTDLDETAE